MKIKRFSFILLLIVPALLLWPLFRQRNLVRGPYLQTLTTSSVVVCWRTAKPVESTVWFGLLATNLESVAGDKTPVTEHRVRISNLKTDTEYYYGISEPGKTTPPTITDFAFITNPDAASSKPVRIWVLGDSGTATRNAAAVRDAYVKFNGARRTDLWLMLGDNAYRQGTDRQYQAAAFEMYPKFLSGISLWPSLGNHDIRSVDLIKETGVYFDIFDLPMKGESGGVASGSERYYSFDYAQCHFICLDSNFPGEEQHLQMIRWLQQDLTANRKMWTIAFFHHPPYTRGSHDSDQEKDRMKSIREQVVPILEAGGVDLVLAGHSHSYERSFLMNGHFGKSDSFSDSFKKNLGDGREKGDGPYLKPSIGPAPHEGTVYVVAGSSGQTSGGSLDHPAMVISTNSLGSLVLDINSNRLDSTFINQRAEVLDQFTLIKGGSQKSVAIR